MKTSSLKELTVTCRCRIGGTRAFTLVELLVVVAVVSMLTALALPSALLSKERVVQAQCAGNLRQIGVGLSIYATEAKGYVPICKYRDLNTWYTYEIARVAPGTSDVTEGYENLGLLFRTKAMTDPKALYCPAQILSTFTYGYHATGTNGWPSSPVGSADDKIRAGYTYFPQLRGFQNMGAGVFLPPVTVVTLSVEVGSISAVAPAKLVDLNPQKSIVTDVVASSFQIHRATQLNAGLNALFPDGKVVFQNARTDPQLFDSTLWANVSNDGFLFRKIMNGWKP